MCSDVFGWFGDANCGYGICGGGIFGGGVVSDGGEVLVVVVFSSSSMRNNKTRKWTFLVTLILAINYIDISGHLLITFSCTSMDIFSPLLLQSEALVILNIIYIYKY